MRAWRSHPRTQHTPELARRCAELQSASISAVDMGNNMGTQTLPPPSRCHMPNYHRVLNSLQQASGQRPALRLASESSKLPAPDSRSTRLQRHAKVPTVSWRAHSAAVGSQSRTAAHAGTHASFLRRLRVKYLAAQGSWSTTAGRCLMCLSRRALLVCVSCGLELRVRATCPRTCSALMPLPELFSPTRCTLIQPTPLHTGWHDLYHQLKTAPGHSQVLCA